MKTKIEFATVEHIELTNNTIAILKVSLISIPDSNSVPKIKTTP